MAGKKTQPETWLALLRGINVGGNNKLPMRELVALFETAGARDVRTYIQSGNVVFTAEDAEKVGATVTKRLDKELGLRVPVVLRSARELARVATSNPLLTPEQDADALHVMFLAGAPSRQAAAGLDPARSPPDTFVVSGREIYLRCPNGLGRSKLTNAYFDGKLDTVSTCRNWRTLLALIELARA